MQLIYAGYLVELRYWPARLRPEPEAVQGYAVAPDKGIRGQAGGLGIRINGDTD